MNTEERERIKELRLKGMGYKAISNITGLSRDSVKGYSRRNEPLGEYIPPNKEERE